MIRGVPDWVWVVLVVLALLLCVSVLARAFVVRVALTHKVDGRVVSHREWRRRS